MVFHTVLMRSHSMNASRRRHLLSISYRSSIIQLVTLMVLLCTSIVPCADAVLPHLAMDITLSTPGVTQTTTMYLSHAFFGAPLPMKMRNGRFHYLHRQSSANFLEQPLTLSYPPDESNPLLCENVTSVDTVSESNYVMLVPRGECTFETKAYNAQLLGASAVIVYGTLASRYSINKTIEEPTVQDIIYPRPKFDYDCSYGNAWIPLQDSTELVLDNPLPYNPEINDPLLAGDTTQNLCILHSTAQNNFSRHCSSRQCLLTGITKTSVNDDHVTLMQGCCAWDLHIWLYADTSNANPPNITIPVAYMTGQQMMELESLIEFSTQWNTNQQQLSVVLYQRWRPTYNISAILIWLLGCTVATLASYLSASEYRTATWHLWSKRQRRRGFSSIADPPDSRRGEPGVASTSQPSADSAPPSPSPDEVLELTAAHAAGFVIMASTSLMVLFYFKIYGIVKVMYAMGCSMAVAQVIFVPLYDTCIRNCYHDMRYRRDVIVWRTNSEEFGDITVRDIVTHVAGFSLGIAWLIIAFTDHEAETITFFWVMQDVFGACMCISFLKVIRLNNIRVASILLIVAFFYDIFFVFITPHIFGGKSVMITVATSGGPPKADPLWCEKYPNDHDCQGGEPLPMLLAIPKLLDYMGGSSLLGLGDIVLPGLLLSFAARYDAAKLLLGVLGGGRPSNQSYSCPEQQCCTGFLPPRCGAILCSGGYFGLLVVAYAVGLAMANTAVYVMNMGQPALLYLVPCCLGTMIYIGWRRNELTQLWDGPRVLLSADNVLCNQTTQSALSVPRGESSIPMSSPNNLHSPIPLEEGYDTDDVLAAPPSAVDDP